MMLWALLIRLSWRLANLVDAGIDDARGENEIDRIRVNVLLIDWASLSCKFSPPLR